MMPTSLLLAMLVSAAVSANAAAQPPANFAGQWIADAAPAPTPPPLPRGDMGSGWGTPLTITQSATELVIEQPFFSRYDLQPALRFVYQLDGSESRNAIMMGHATQVRVSRAAWDGAALKITTLYPARDPATGKTFTTEVTQRLTLDSPTSLVVEVTRAGALGGPATSTRVVYRKAER
jgi:hypothetical protein